MSLPGPHLLQGPVAPQLGVGPRDSHFAKNVTDLRIKMLLTLLDFTFRATGKAQRSLSWHMLDGT